jgi:RNA polymerase sigma factor for flagellar operon FliA
MTPAEVAYQRSAVSTTSEEELVVQELQQVYYIAARIRERLPQHVELEDLVSAGVVGLIEATRSFDGSKNIQFKTFAKFRIRGAILDSLRETDWGSRYMRRRAREISDVTARLEARLGRHPAEQEIAREMDVEPEQLQKILGHLNSLQITGQQVRVSNSRADMLDVIESAPDLDDPGPFELCVKGEVKAHLAEAISKLSEREQLILSLYYREELTMKEIAKVVGLSLSRVSQIREETMVKLKTLLRHMENRKVPIAPKRGEHFEYA